MGFVANGVDVSGARYFYVGKKRVVELACSGCGEIYQAKEEFSLADKINKCQCREKKICVCEKIVSINVGYVPSDECFGCQEGEE